eukprot:CAMPEP_0197187726 /NCGR_PEP_ID=MMETSP1423-20130617/16422_1 /TAXON_ID=476441 /ORGANISM="Pseudo-nitzschia heimii, Strain UNC1101" /LENGTH=105 /DNA_ID=CAMNT_0042639379 /DNA_START=84 /DNA_END=401 /DNA_ORIENTATION=+
MTSLRFVSTLLIVAISFLAFHSSAFVQHKHNVRVAAAQSKNTLMGLLDGEQERNGLTRDSEPEEFFATNTDKMSDEEKIPIALAGLAGISLPFILGLIALYAAQG